MFVYGIDDIIGVGCLILSAVGFGVLFLVYFIKDRAEKIAEKLHRKKDGGGE